MRKSDLIHQFTERLNFDVAPHYVDREDRNRWAASFLQTFPGKSVLNLGGGGKRHLGKHLGQGWTVHEVDITGDCDTRLDLDSIDRLPFEDASFDTGCALEVLEHLENFHLVADELFRVSRSNLLISLPNAAVELFLILRDKRPYDDPMNNGVYSKFNGLPLATPEDRHRWWMTFEDIIRYFLWFERNKSCRLEFLVPTPDPTVKRKLLRLILGERMFLNFFCTNVWARIQKT